jgi:hypothetical protein
VVGKHVPGLAWIDTLLSDGPALTVESSYYQRLLARDQAEASDLMEKFIKTHDADTVYDAMLIPALNSAERDRVEGRLSADEEAAVVETTGDMIELLMPSARAALAAGHRAGVRVLGYAANGPSDLLALRMLAQTMTGLPIQLDVSPPRLLASELVALVVTEGYTVVCLADLPPSAPSKTRYLIKKLRAALPDVRIAVGRWAPAPFADDSLAPLLEAGASHASSQLLDTRKYLAELASVGLAA